jgi:hypothetical protein
MCRTFAPRSLAKHGLVHSVWRNPSFSTTQYFAKNCGQIAAETRLPAGMKVTAAASPIGSANDVTVLGIGMSMLPCQTVLPERFESCGGACDPAANSQASARHHPLHAPGLICFAPAIFAQQTLE